jgi:thymidine kinase
MSKVYFYYSAMNAGKSTVLLQSSYNYHERGMRTLLFMPATDTRSGPGRIESRIGLASDAIALQSGENLLERVRQEHDSSPVACVLIDEAQFLSPEQVRQATDVADSLRIPVLCYGLRTDSRERRASCRRRQPDRAQDNLPLRPQGDDEPARRPGWDRGQGGGAGRNWRQ